MSETTLDNDPASTLSALEALHEEELSVLKNMDRASLDDITLRKEQLCERLREEQLAGRLNALHRSQIERIRQKAAHNQLLVVHARDAVRSILSQATGVSLDVSPATGLPAGRRGAVQEGLRLNVRG